MRWIFGIIKILFTVFVLAFFIKFFLVFIPNFHPVTFLNQIIKKGVGYNQHHKNPAAAVANSSDDGGEYTSKYEALDTKDSDNMYDTTVPDDNDITILQEEGSDIQNTDTSGEDYIITQDEISSIEKISLSDKLTCLSIARKINKDDLNTIMSLAAGGITADEMREINNILEKNLSKKELDKLHKILAKNKKLFAGGVWNN